MREHSAWLVFIQNEPLFDFPTFGRRYRAIVERSVCRLGERAYMAQDTNRASRAVLEVFRIELP